MPDAGSQVPPAGRRILVSGASGLIGRALTEARQAAGDTVVPLVRTGAAANHILAWDGGRTPLPPERVSGFDAVVHLAGEPVGGLWTAGKKRRILESRVQGTAALARAIAAAERPPAVFVCASGINFYGDCGSRTLDESAPAGSGFLAEVCKAWEGASQAAAGVSRVANLRIGVVLAARGGALAASLPLFRLGLGGSVDGGKPYMSWISLEDVVRAIGHVLDSGNLRGGVNVVSPHPVTNGEFTADLAAALRRPAVLRAPGWLVRLIVGEMAVETVLSSVRALPRQLEADGFVFRDPTLPEALARLRL